MTAPTKKAEHLQPFFTWSDDKAYLSQFFLNPKATSAAESVWRDGTLEVQKGLWAEDPLLLEVKSKLAHRLNTDFPVMMDENGRVFGNGVRSDFNGLLHLSGLGMVPATWPLVDNIALRKTHNLTEGYDENGTRCCSVRLFDW